VVSSFFSSPILSGRRLHIYHTSTHDVALMRIQNACLKCAARGSLEIQDAKMTPKNRHLCIIAQLCRAMSSQQRHVSTIGEKLVMQQYLLQISPQYGELRPTNGWHRLASLGHPSKFHVLASLLQQHRLLEANQTARCLGVSWAGTLYIHFRFLHFHFAPWRNFSRCKIHFASKNCILLYCQRNCTALQQRASAKICGVGEWVSE